MTRETLTAEIAKVAHDSDKLNDVIELLWEMAKRDGANDLITDLWDAEEISEQGLEFAITNNRVADPRRRRR